jgi:hypothetical protein
MFKVYGENTDTVLFENDTCQVCVDWCDLYGHIGDFGGWRFLTLIEDDDGLELPVAVWLVPDRKWIDEVE